jgi:hypothetical protein
LLTLQWFTTVVAVVVAVASLVRARALARRLDRLTESYWELRYDYGQLRSRVAQLDPAAGQNDAPVQERAPTGQIAFVPLSSLKR